MKTYKIAVIPGDGVGPEVLKRGNEGAEAGSGVFRSLFPLRIPGFPGAAGTIWSMGR